jgi:hypothetical protein
MGAARASNRRAEYSAATSARYVSASASVPWNVTDRCNVRPVTGSVPATTRISQTPGRRSRLVPEPLVVNMATKVGMNVGMPAHPYTADADVAAP